MQGMYTVWGGGAEKGQQGTAATKNTKDTCATKKLSYAAGRITLLSFASRYE